MKYRLFTIQKFKNYQPRGLSKKLIEGNNYYFLVHDGKVHVKDENLFTTCVMLIGTYVRLIANKSIVRVHE